MRDALWDIVLAAGSGRRLARITGGVPKQFWSPDGGPSLLEDTLIRTAPLAPPNRTVIVIDRTHAPFMRALHGIESFDRVVSQPSDRGTAIGVLLGLTTVINAAPDAIVLLSPSDHGVTKPDAFRAGIAKASVEVRSRRANIVMFGVTPERPEPDYGWITPAGARIPTSAFRPVAAFVEKPAPDVARRLFESGAVWNTMVLVARASALLALYRRYLPDVLAPFTCALRLDTPRCREFLRSQYELLPNADFSRDVLGRSGDLLLHTWPADIGWSDLGTPDRLERWRIHESAHEFRQRARTGMPALQSVS